MPRVYLTTKELADYLKITPCTLEGMRMNGSGPPYYKVGPFRNRLFDTPRKMSMRGCKRTTSTQHPIFERSETEFVLSLESDSAQSLVKRRNCAACIRSPRIAPCSSGLLRGPTYPLDHNTDALCELLRRSANVNA